MAMHRLPHDHDLVPPWRQVAVLAGFTTVVCGLGALLTRSVWDVNALWWLPAAPVLQWFGMRYVAGRGGGGYAPQEGSKPDDSPTVRLEALEEDSPYSGHRSGDLGLGDALDRPGRHALREEPEMSEPLQLLQFTQEEIDHAMHVLSDRELNGDGDLETTVRTVLRAVRAVPARCLNSGPAGHPARIGENVQGSGNGGRTVRGTVISSYPVTTTTTVRTPSGETDYLWTNTIRSWDPSTAKVIIGPPSTGRMVMQPIPFGYHRDPDHLRADDDGMPCEEGR